LLRFNVRIWIIVLIMQRNMRMNELQLLALSEKALNDNGLRGLLFKRTSDNSKWQLRWFVLFQNLLFYFENETSNRPSGLIFLEGSYCDKIVQPSAGKNSTNTQVSYHSLYFISIIYSPSVLVIILYQKSVSLLSKHWSNDKKLVYYKLTYILAFIALQMIYSINT
jgi:hypothetical protein